MLVLTELMSFYNFNGFTYFSYILATEWSLLQQHWNLLYWVQQDLQFKKSHRVLMEAASCIPATLTSLLSVPVPFKYTTLIE